MIHIIRKAIIVIDGITFIIRSLKGTKNDHNKRRPNKKTPRK